jgi:hypothetical protein
MILQNIMSAAALDSTITTTPTNDPSLLNSYSVISLVMSYDSGQAFEIQFDNSDVANPVPSRFFSYQANSGGGTSNFENSDFSKVLGVSAKSRFKFYN